LSAIFTAFILALYGTLQNDNTGASVQLLHRISLQLANQPLDDVPLPRKNFRPTRVAQAVNALWFSSLILSLFAALYGIFVKQWVHTYYGNWTNVQEPGEAVRLRNLYRDGLKSWHLLNIVEILPLLLQLSLLFFLAGLVTFLWTLDTVVAGFSSVLVVTGIMATTVAIILPVYFDNCPYKSPHGLLLVRIFNPNYASWRQKDLSLVRNEFDIDKNTVLQPYKDMCALLEISPTADGSISAEERVETCVDDVYADPRSFQLLQAVILQFAQSPPFAESPPSQDKWMVVHSMLRVLAAVDSRGRPPAAIAVIQGFVKHVAEMRVQGSGDLIALDYLLTSTHALAIRIARHRGTPKTSRLVESTTQLLNCLQQWMYSATTLSPQVKDDYNQRWYTLRGLLRQNTLLSHTAEVYCATFSHDGKRIVSGSDDHIVCVWDANTGAVLQKLQGHTGAVLSIAFSSDGARIVSASTDQTVRVWDAKAGAVINTLKDHTDWVRSVAFSQDGTRIVSGSDDESVRVWNAETGAVLLVLQGHLDYVRSVAFSPDGKSIVSGSDDETVRVWNADTGAAERTLDDHTGYVRSVSFSSDGTHIVSGSNDQTVRVWVAATGECSQILKGHTGEVCSVAFSPDKIHIVSASEDQTARVWDTSTGKTLQTFPGHTSAVCSVAFSPHGNRIVSGSADHTVRVWVADIGATVYTLQGHVGAISSIEFSEDGKSIISRSSLGSSHTWNAPVDFPLPVMTPLVLTLPTFTFKNKWVLGQTNPEVPPERLFWVVSDRRGEMSYHGRRVVIASKGGTVTLIDFTGVI
jgi:WD40 repeat protein